MKRVLRDRYRCSDCGRVTEMEVNTKGLTVFGKCILTSNCEGELIRESGLDSRTDVRRIDKRDGGEPWKQTVMLYKHHQDTPEVEWTIDHRMGSIPTLVVYDSTGGEVFDFRIIRETSQSAVIALPTMMEGEVHCIRRESSIFRQPEPDSGLDTQEIFDYSNKLPIAIKFPHIGAAESVDVLNLNITFFRDTISGGTRRSVLVHSQEGSQTSQWYDITYVTLFGNRSNVYKIFWIEVPTEFATLDYSFAVNEGLPMDDSILLLERRGVRVIDRKISLSSKNLTKKFEIGRDFIMTIGGGLEKAQPPIRILE